jgi:hypothetical protein
MKLASRSAILSLSSAKAGSRDARGSAELDSGPEGVVCEARKEVREGGRRGVVGRELAEGLRACDGVAILCVIVCDLAKSVLSYSLYYRSSIYCYLCC